MQSPTSPDNQSAFRRFRSGPALGFLALLLLLAGAQPAHAGKRHTVWAYPPGAGPKGSVEFETWITATKPTKDSGTDVEYRIEIENGITDDISLDLYLAVIKQPAGEAAKLDAVQASLRANILPSLRSALDLTGYFEIKRDIDFGNPWEFEAILIGGKSFGRWSYDFNLVYESEISSSAFKKDAREMKGILGGGYEVTPRIWVGGEFVAENDKGTREYSIGPTVSIGLTNSTWLGIGPQFGLNDDADHLKVRALFGIFF